MADRWKRWLSPLDDGEPSREVFDRAKTGPSGPEEPIELPSGRSRVITGVAAFVVFALAISVFVVPALRFDGTADQGATAETAIHPIWPMASVDEARGWQDRVDAGDSSAVFATDPEQVAREFGWRVLGWNDATVRPATPAGGYPTSCIVDGQGTMTPCPYQVPSGAVAGTDLATTARPSGPGTAGYVIYPCAPATCDSLVPQLFVIVTLYQPLEVGDGKVWGVLDVSSPRLQLSEPATLHDRDAISMSAQIPTDLHAILGYHGGSGSCSFSGGTAVYHSPGPSGGEIPAGFQMQVDVPTAGQGGCGSTEPGYVYGLISEVNPTNLSLWGSTGGQGPMTDPLTSIGETGVASFAAVPVLFVLPQPQASESVAWPTESATPTQWTTHTDKLGWTIDVPTGWATETVDGSDGRRTYEGAAFASGPITHTPAGPAALSVDQGEVLLEVFHAEGGPYPAPQDDSTFPLSYDAMSGEEGGQTLSFRGDGLPFDLVIRYGALTPEQERILRRMVGSIRFEPWSPGERRGRYVATAWSTSQVGIGNPVVVQDSGRYWVLVEQDQAPDGSYVLYGPVPLCPDGSLGDVTIVGPHSSVSFSCPDGTKAGWIGVTTPDDSNPPAYSSDLPEVPLIAAWDGTLLAPVDSPLVGGS